MSDYSDYQAIRFMLQKIGMQFQDIDLTDWGFPKGWRRIECGGQTVHDGPINFIFEHGNLKELRSDL